MDSSHISLVSLYLSSSEFDHYRYDIDTVIGVNLSSLALIFKQASGCEEVYFEPTNRSDILQIEFSSNEKVKNKYKYKNNMFYILMYFIYFK